MLHQIVGAGLRSLAAGSESTCQVTHQTRILRRDSNTMTACLSIPILALTPSIQTSYRICQGSRILGRPSVHLFRSLPTAQSGPGPGSAVPLTAAEARRQSAIKPEPHSDTPHIPWYFSVVIWAAVLAVFAGYLWTELKHNARPGFQLDDPWIHLTFARNLARGAPPPGRKTRTGAKEGMAGRLLQPLPG